MMERVDTLMQRALSENIFPGGVLLFSKEDALIFGKAYGYANIFSKRKMTRDTVFDLASLTKPLATTLAVMRLIQQGKLDLEQNLGSVLPQFKKTDKDHINIRGLLGHNSGLPDYRPYYKTLCELAPEVRKDSLRDLLVKESLLFPAGERVLYSDLGFMLLEWIVENLSGRRLDHFVSEAVYRPIGVSPDAEQGLFFVDRALKPCKERFAATELCPWRNILIEGMVHDENAYVVGGVAGHAGLFGTADDVHRLLSELLASFHGYSFVDLFPKILLHTFFERHGDIDRPLGFDCPSWPDASCGKYFSETSVGHLGFTGTSFWMDLDRSIIVILLTNRVHPSRNNTKIKAFRPKLHDVVMETLNPNVA
jgi:CubicO group peptidase (beta-lactamase class C family)